MNYFHSQTSTNVCKTNITDLRKIDRKSKKTSKIAVTTKASIKRIKSVGCTQRNKKLEDLNKPKLLSHNKNSNYIPQQNFNTSSVKLSPIHSLLPKQPSFATTKQPIFCNRQSFSIIPQPGHFNQNDSLLNTV